MNKKNKSFYKKKLWKVFSKYIRLRDNCTCISCGKKDEFGKMDAGHYIPKTAGNAIYFDERNVNCQCTYCNRFMHGNLTKYAIALRKKYGEGILEELDQKRNQIVIFTENDYLRMIEEYKNKIKQLE